MKIFSAIVLGHRPHWMLFAALLCAFPPRSFAQIITFSNGSSQSAIPTFGGYDPNSVAQLNIRGSGFSLGIAMGKGSTRTISSTVPSLMVPNGFGGSLFSGSLQPFVTGVIPVIGGNPNYSDYSPPVNGVTLARESGMIDFSALGDPERSRANASGAELPTTNSSATTGFASVDAIRERKERERLQQERLMKEHLEASERSAAEHDYSTARSELRAALRHATTDNHRTELKDRLLSLRGK